MTPKQVITTAAVVAAVAAAVVGIGSRAPKPKPVDQFYAQAAVMDAGPIVARESPCFRELAGSPECIEFLRNFKAGK